MSNVTVKQDNQEDWQFLPIKDFAYTTSGGTPRRGIAEYYGGDVPWVKSGDLNDGQLSSVDEYITVLGLEKSSAKLFKPGTLLIALYGATIGRLSILNFEAASNQAVCGITLPEETDVKYVFYYLLSIRRKLISQGKGGAQPNINQQIVKETVVPLAPPEQQKRIVAKIEELFSHIDAGIEALKKAKQLLKQYRQSVLKAAVTGEFTKEWREANKDKLEPASQLLERILKERRQKWEEQQIEQFKAKGKMPKDDKWKEKYLEPEVIEPKELEVLPEGWKVVTLSSLCTQIGDVDHKMPKAKESGVPYISTKDFTSGNGINFKNAKLIEIKDYEHLCRKIYPEFGDVLLSRYGTVGEVRKIAVNFPFQASYSIAIIKPASTEIGPYISFILTTEPLQRQIKKHTRSTAQPDLGLSHIREFEVPLPPIQEQEEIMQIIEEKLSSIEHLDEELEQQLLKSETNKRSVLAAAFSGNII